MLEIKEYVKAESLEQAFELNQKRTNQIIGGMLSYPVAYLVMGNKAAALFTFVVPFLISTCGGTIIAIIITLPLKKSGMLGRMKESLEE